MAWAPDYITSAELKAYTRINSSADDAEVAQAVSAASRAVDRATGRQFGQVAVAEERFYTPEWDRRRCRWFVRIDDLATVTNLVVEVDGTAVTDYTLEPRNAVAKGLVWTELVLGTAVTGVPSGSSAVDSAAITALWGWASVPVAVKYATKVQADRFLSRRDSPYGVAGSPADGSELRLLAAVDPDVRVSLSRYCRMWGAV